MRGWLHLIAAPIVAICGLALALATHEALVAVIIYAIAGTALFTVSATYHRHVWQGRAQEVISRLDHSMIFVIIAASYTPIVVALMPGDQARALLIVVWTGALAGVAFRVLWFRAPRWLYTPLYLVLGYAIVPFTPAIAGAGWIVLALIILSGLCYTLGAVVYGLEWPNPSPRVFGFHEIFHSFTLGGWTCHFAATWLVLAV